MTSDHLLQFTSVGITKMRCFFSLAPRAGPACTVRRISHSIRSVNYLFHGRFEIQGPPSPSPTGLENKPCYEHDVQGMDPKVAIGWTRIAGNSDCFFFKSNENIGEFVEDSNSLTCLGTGHSCEYLFE